MRITDVKDTIVGLVYPLNPSTLKELARALITFIPKVRSLWQNSSSGGGTNSASYCYGVWLKHFVFLKKSGLPNTATTIAELGPGDSLGTGYAALMSGFKNYYALDVVPRELDTGDGTLLSEMSQLFRSKAPRPVKGWPDFDDLLDDSFFPSQHLSDAFLQQNITRQHLKNIAEAEKCSHSENKNISIKYVAPWSDSAIIETGSVDVVFSHGVIEYVESLKECYETLWEWLKPGGLMSHSIDLSGHSLSPTWDGFRTYNEPLWHTLCGNRPYRLNREPYSAHIEAIIKAGFEITVNEPRLESQYLPVRSVAKKWKDLGEQDRSISGLFVQAKKI